MKRTRFYTIALSLTLLLFSGIVSRAQLVGTSITPCTQTALINTNTASGNVQLVAAPLATGGNLTYLNGQFATNPTVGNRTGPSVHICSIEYHIHQSASAVTYGLVSSLGTGVVSGTYTSGGTIVGSSTQTCNVTFSNNGIVGGTATVALTGTNTIAGSTALTIVNAGYGATSAPTTATLSNGTATCSGTATVATVITPCAGVGAAVTTLTPAYEGVASTVQDRQVVYTAEAAIGAPPLNAVCVNLSGAPTGSQFFATYAIY
ncbi:MAG: hypothetical protein WAN50_00380 [Minisyncoccia bacterium]